MVTQRSNTGNVVSGLILIGLGVIFLLGQFINFSAWQLVWPLLVMGAGGMFFAGMLAGGKSAAGLAVPGSIISVIGAVLLYQNFTRHWNSWAYAWTLIVLAVGVGLWIAGRWGDDAQQRHSGLRVMQVGVVMFILFGIFFEGFIFGFSGARWQRIIFPVLLVLFGLYLLVRRSGLWPNPAAATPAPMPDTTSTPPDGPPPSDAPTATPAQDSARSAPGDLP